MTDAARWARIKQIFDAAIACRPEDRATLLRDMCGDDAGLQAEVESLLAADAAQEAVFDRSPRRERARVFDARTSVPNDGTYALAPGDRVGSYEIVALLGAGGMGEVYRAHDRRLKREVAVKVLPEAFASDPEQLARFEREAEILASLNHPNIAQLHGIHEGDPVADAEPAVTALVMELVEGETLADRIATGPLPLDTALSIARQIAGALEAAHERGIIHRDLKPSNIKVTSDGTVKVLDFGLAKTLQPATAAPQGRVPHAARATPTVSRAGVILGTAAYMSPEQARGRAIDRRADIWAFGCVLYEMLTGRPAFDRDSIVDTLGAVMLTDPDWTKLPATTPSSIHRLLRRSLHKDPARRLRDIGDATHEIDEASVDLPTTDATPSRLSLRSGHRRSVATLVAAVALLGAAAVWTQRPDESVDATTLVVGWTDVGIANGSLLFALAPDGTRFVYVGVDGRLWVREFHELQPRALTGTDKAAAPFFSPDGRSIAFTTLDEGALKIVPAQGGSVRTVFAGSGKALDGDWSADGMLYFSRASEGVARVAPVGGAVEPVSRPSEVGVTHRWVDVLPNGQAALVTIRDESVNTSEIGLLDLRTGGLRPLFPGALARFARSGHVVYATADGVLHAVPFDENRLQLTGSPVPLIEKVRVGIWDSDAWFTLADNGTLVYQREFRPEAELVWVAKDGQATPLTTGPWTANFFSLSLSPDGKQLAATVETANRQDVWTRSLETGAMNRLTFDTDGSLNYRAKWSADGRAVTFISNRSGAAGELWRQRADGSMRAERLVADGPIIDEGLVSPDGQWAVYRSGGSDLRSRDVKAVRLGNGDQAPQALVATPSEEYSPVLSADGRWLAYVSEESGRPEVYVRPFPNTDTAAWQVSRDGGLGPIWAPSGRQLFYRNARRELVAVTTRTGDTFGWDPPQVLFDLSAYQLNPHHPLYDVSRDGQRFLLARRIGSAGGDVVVIFNWLEQVKKQLGETKKDRQASSTDGR